MANYFSKFINVLNFLDKQNVDYILIGGVAVILHGFERLTRDIDIFVKSTPENIDKLKKALYLAFDDPSIKEITLTDLQDYCVIRYGTPDDFYIDIIARLGEAFAYEDLEFEVIKYRGIKIKIATPETLYNLKKDTIRYKDKIDAMFLKELIKEKITQGK